ncbi:hypothetical protein ABZT06_40465 [Streptomyces sp. NPDC005483]|uniref:PP_RS20740 family protein n=1 Tax=Streptomyces sp. NPDC005483 TaxID=3154882 RepID=UPI00339FDED8
MAEEVTGSSEPDDLRDILGDGPPPFPAKIEREFKPWHRPRKQYVRNSQWSREIGILARDLNLRGSELRYLTLPGNDLLDIRHIAETVCSPREVTLRYLGFNSAAAPLAVQQSDLNSAEFSIIRMGCIHPQSEVYSADFRSVGQSRSPEWHRVKRDAPFHAINIDLCGGFAGVEKAGGVPNYFAALQAILQHQMHSDEDFLLFITTRMDDSNVDVRVKETLIGMAQDIHDTCQAYASEFAASWGLQENVSPVHVADFTDAGEAFMLGLTQWIISRGVDLGLKASVKSFMTYRTGNGQGVDDIVSLAIRFKPDPVIQPDPHDLIRVVNPPASPTDKMCAQSSTVPGRVSNRTRVDEMLRAQADEFERCIRESSELLGAAGYDASRYREWVMQEDGQSEAPRGESAEAQPGA